MIILIGYSVSVSTSDGAHAWSILDATILPKLRIFPASDLDSELCRCLLGISTDVVTTAQQRAYSLRRGR